MSIIYSASPVVCGKPSVLRTGSVTGYKALFVAYSCVPSDTGRNKCNLPERFRSEIALSGAILKMNWNCKNLSSLKLI